MDMTGEYRIPAPRAKVWAALNDPETLRASLPGCESLEKVSETQFVATVVAKVGPVKAKFNGNVELTNLNPPESYTIAGEGKGGAAGFAKGSADVRLAEEGAETTLLAYTARADVGGKLAQLGSRLIDGTAKKMADEFFNNFRQQLTPPAVQAVVEAEREYAPQPEPAPAGGLAELAQNKFVWAAAAIIVLMILVLLFR
jgi:carbon monoxide dehydrogenase subunit G